MKWMTGYDTRCMVGEPDGGGGGTFTQADLDAAVAKAAKEAAAPLAELQKANADLAKKIAGFETAQKKKDGDLQGVIDALTPENERLKAENAELGKIRDAFHADQADRWKGLETELGKTDQGKKLLANAFVKADSPEAVSRNHETYRMLSASGVIEGLKPKGSLGELNRQRADDKDATARPLDRLADGIRKQMGGGN